MSRNRAGFGIAYDDYNHNIYAIGGELKGMNLDHCEKYSVETNTWTVIRPMPYELKNLSVCNLNN